MTAERENKKVSEDEKGRVTPRWGVASKRGRECVVERESLGVREREIEAIILHD